MVLKKIFSREPKLTPEEERVNEEVVYRQAGYAVAAYCLGQRFGKLSLSGLGAKTSDSYARRNRQAYDFETPEAYEEYLEAERIMEVADDAALYLLAKSLHGQEAFNDGEYLEGRYQELREYQRNLRRMGRLLDPGIYQGTRETVDAKGNLIAREAVYRKIPVPDSDFEAFLDGLNEKPYQQGLDEYLEYVEKACKILSRSENWAAVQALASALLKIEEIEYWEGEKIISEAIARAEKKELGNLKRSKKGRLRR